MTATKSRGMSDPVWRLAEKSAQDLLDRLSWLEERDRRAEARIAHWMNERVTRGEQIADVRRALLLKGVVDVSR